MVRYGTDPASTGAAWRLPPIPVALVFWAAASVALNIGVARLTYGVMLPSLRRDLGLSYLSGGNLNAVHLAGYLIGTLIGPMLGRRIGMAALSVRAHLLIATGAVGCALIPETNAGIYLLGISRVATGFGAGLGIVAVLVVTFNSVPASRRPLVSAVVWAGLGVAVALSGLAAPALIETSAGWRVAFALSAALALAIALFFPPRKYSDLPQTDPGAGDASFSPRALLSTRWFFLLASYFLFGVGYIAYSTFAGTRLAATNASMLTIQLTWTLLGIAAVAGAALVLPVLNNQKIKQFALFGTLLPAGLGALIVAIGSAPAALAGAVLVGLGIASTPSIITAYARDRCSADAYPRAFSLVTAALGAGQFIGPVVAGWLADQFGTVAVPIFAATAYLIGAAMAVCDGQMADRS